VAPGVRWLCAPFGREPLPVRTGPDPARRPRPRSALPEAVATAVIEFLTGALVENPHRVGKPLRGDLAGIYSARRGAYRVLYRIGEVEREVFALRIDPGETSADPAERLGRRARAPDDLARRGYGSGLDVRRPCWCR
jgi:mRNA interferase RelE/StbE